MAAPNPSEHVDRAEYGRELNMYHYDATSGAPLCGWSKVDDKAGAINEAGEGTDHFAGAEHDGCPPGPWEQT